MDQNIKEITERYETKLNAELGAEVNKFKAGGQYDKRISTEKKSELAARARKIINTEQLAELSGVIDMLSEQSDDDEGQTKYYILMDKLDERWVDDSVRFKLIRALIESLKQFRRVHNLKILVALRSDILERVIQETGDIGFQREKFEDYFVRLKWSPQQLRELVDRRVSLTFRRQYSTARPITFDDLFYHKIDSLEPFQYLLDRTLHRPRDIITFVNECLKLAEGRNQVTANMVRQAEREFSRIRRSALENEWRSAFPTLPRLLDYMQASNGPTFEFPALCDRGAVEELALPMTEDKVDFDPLHEPATRLFSGDMEPTEYMRVVVGILYRVGAVGVKPNPRERFYYSHADQPVMDMAVLGDESRLRVHPMLHRSMGIEAQRDGKRTER